MKLKKVINEWKWTILVGFGILVLGLVLRLINLTILPVFADEAIYIRWAQVMRAEPTLRFLPLSDGKQPLFMWLVIPFLKIFTDPLIAGRMTSVLAGTGSLIGVFLLTNYLFKEKKVALIASFIYTISLFTVFFDRMALVDSLLTMFGVWTLFLGVLTAKTLRFDFAMLTGFSLGGALLTKSPGIFFAGLLPLVYIFLDWKQKRNPFLIHILRLAFFLLVIYLIAFGMYSIQRLGPNYELLSSRTKDYIFPISKMFLNPGDPFIYNFPDAFRWIWMMGPSAVLIFGLFGVFVNFKKFPKEIIILISWFIMPLIYESAFAKVFTARYILFLLPPFYVLAASIFLLKNRLSLKIAVFGLLVFTVHAFWIDRLLLTDPMRVPLPRRERSGYLEEWTSGIGIKQVADFISAQHVLNPNKKIVVGTEGFFGTLPDGLQIYLQGVPNIVVIGTGLAFNEIPQSLMESKEAGNITYFLVNNSRLAIDPAKLNLTLLFEYPKGLRVQGTREYSIHGSQEKLLFFEVGSNVADDKKRT